MNLDLISHQVGLALDESRTIRAEIRELREESDNLGRVLEHVREDLIVAVKMELRAVLAGFEARLESRIADAIEDAKNAPRA